MGCVVVVMMPLPKTPSISRTHTRKRMVMYGTIALACVLLDQLLKAYMRSSLVEGVSTDFIPGVLKLQLTYNEGAAFSIGEGGGTLFALLALAVALGAGIWIAKSPSMPLLLVCSLACVAGGGLGNCIDRLYMGAVTDFFACAFIRFPIFNVADIFVTCGAAVAFVGVMRWDTDNQ